MPQDKPHPEESKVVKEFYTAIKGDDCPTLQQVVSWLERYPELAKQPDPEGKGYDSDSDSDFDSDSEGELEMCSVPLHAILERFAPSAPLELIQVLVEAWPNALRLGRQTGRSPLHLACWYKAPLTVIKFLTEKFPESLMTDDIYYTPVAYVMSRKTGLDVLEYFCQHWGEKAFFFSRKRKQQQGKREKQLKRKVFFGSARKRKQERGEREEHLLHQVLEWDITRHYKRPKTPPVEYLQVLVKYRPELIVQPIHLSTSYTSRDYRISNLQHALSSLPKTDEEKKWPAIIKWLIQLQPAYVPDDLETKGLNAEFLLALMRTISSKGLQGHFLEALQLVVDAWPEATRWLNVYGYFPLDFAIKFPREILLPYLVDNEQQALHFYFRHGGSTAETVDWLLNDNFGTVREPDAEGNLPLHLAIRSGRAELPILKKLMDIFPDAAVGANQEGRLPLHLAAKHLKDPRLVPALAEINPDGIVRRDNQGWLPFQLAAQNETRLRYNIHGKRTYPSLEMVYHLLRMAPDSLQCSEEGS